MARRINSIGLCAIVLLCILLIFASHRMTFSPFTSNESDASSQFNHIGDHRRPNNGKYYQIMHGGGGSSGSRQYGNRRAGGTSGTFGAGGEIATMSTNTYNTTVRIEDVINEQRQLILDEMKDFEYTEKTLNLGALTPETGGRPVQSVILSTWRSGSTFLGDILNAMPANYYHYEPLLHYDIVQIRGKPNAQHALHTLRQLLLCNYTTLTDYLDYGQAHNYLFSHNTRLWHECNAYPQFCWDPKFLNDFCRLFPFQSMKVVRLRAALAEELLKDDMLNVKIVLLVRDPRGTIQSRKHREWCPGQPDCDNPALLCSDMVADYKAAIDFSSRYAGQFKAIRYEDLSLDPFKMTKEILDFYGLPFDPEVEEFLDSHTRTDIGGVSSTFRDSKTAPFHWMRDLSFDEVQNIQLNCIDAMRLWGYRQATDESSLVGDKFNSMLKFPFA